jgi:3-methylfumaryl-CoA hydratase
MSATFTDWIGRTDEAEEVIPLTPALAAAAILEDSTPFAIGSQLPPLWHWFYFLPKVPQSLLGADGHPRRGGFMPPIDLPRRMFAGARIRFPQPLIIGRPATRQSVIRDVSTKEGRSGRLAFVTVAHTIRQDGAVCVEEEQDIVYREPGTPVAAPTVVDLPAVPTGSWTRTVKPDPVLLFRFSALTFNAHRIHYDRPYATAVEGYPGLVVHGPLIAVLLLELVRRQPESSVTAFAFRALAPLFDGASFRLIATPTATRIELEAQGPDGRTAMTASATVTALPSAGSPTA